MNDYTSLVQQYSKNITLPKKEKQAMISDLLKAAEYLESVGVSQEEITLRLSYEKLGDFYSSPALSWYPLDFSAKIYPVSMKRGQMAIFRLSVYLKQDIVPQLLQMALTFTIKRFPFFAVTVRAGFFWHHLDTIKCRFPIFPDNGRPCVPINISRNNSPALRVLYYKNRISVEFFHVLTDGNGGMIFLKTLTAEYLRLTGVNIENANGVLDISETPKSEEFSNDFEKFYTPGKAGGFVEKRAAQMGGKLSKTKPCRVIHMDLDAGELLKVSHNLGVTVTALVTSALFYATKKALPKNSRGKVQIQVPVNMRKFYESSTLRNFAMYCILTMNPQDISEPETISGKVSADLKQLGSRESMTEMMRSTYKLVTSLKSIPLFIKGPVARIIYGFLGDKVISNTLSNLGVIMLPPSMNRYVEKFDFVLGTLITNRAACSLVSYGNHAMLSMEKLTEDKTFEETLGRTFKSLGINYTLSGSDYYGDK